MLLPPLLLLLLHTDRVYGANGLEQVALFITLAKKKELLPIKQPLFPSPAVIRWTSRLHFFFFPFPFPPSHSLSLSLNLTTDLLGPDRIRSCSTFRPPYYGLPPRDFNSLYRRIVAKRVIAMDFTGQYQFAGTGQAYHHPQFMPIPPLTPSHSHSAGSDEYNASPPVSRLPPAP